MEYTSIRIAKPDRDALKAAADRDGVSIAAKLHRLIEAEQIDATSRAAAELLRAMPQQDLAFWEAEARRAGETAR